MCFARPTWARRTNVSGCSSSPWPTPTNRDGKAGEHEPDGKRGISLIESTRSSTGDDWPTPTARDQESPAKLTRGANASPGGTPLVLKVLEQWPTPTAGDRDASGSRNLPGSHAHAGISLTDLVLHGGSSTPRAWPTPRAEDSESTGTHKGRASDTLTSAARAWPTPSATDHKGSSQPGQRRGQLSEAIETGRPCSPTSAPARVIFAGPPDPEPTSTHGSRPARLRLNPHWVACLMGFPATWAELPLPLLRASGANS